MSLKQRLANLAKAMAPRGRVIVIKAESGQDIQHLLEPLNVSSADIVIRLRGFHDDPPPPQLSAVHPMVE